jgi:hypothetical protein
MVQRDLGRPVPLRKNISLVPSGKSTPLIAASSPTRGALRDRHERWVRDAMDVLARETNAASRVRQSRVVLTPRRWCQVGGMIRR